jgi:predicted transcriptional regulator
MQIESHKVFCDLGRDGKFYQGRPKSIRTLKSAVSQQIQRPGRLFKSLLIERSKKRFRLTREGQVLYDYSKQVVRTYDACSISCRR